MLAQALHSVQFTISSDCVGWGSVILIGQHTHLYIRTYTPLWNVSTGLPQKQAIPALPVNMLVTMMLSTVLFIKRQSLSSTVWSQGSAQWADTLLLMQSVPTGRSVFPNLNRTDWEEGPDLVLEEGSRRGAGAWRVMANLRGSAGWVWEGALVGVYKAPVWWPVMTLAPARRVNAELCIVAGEKFTCEAIFTDTREGLAGRGVSSLLWLKAGGFVMTWIRAGDKCPCEKYEDSLMHAAAKFL